MKKAVWLGIALVGCVAVATQAAGIREDSLIGKRVDNFELSTHRGTRWTFDDQGSSRLVVIAFLGTECPLAKLYGPRLGALHKRFSKRGVAFVGINANTQDSMTEVTAYTARYEIPFPMLKDVGNRVADEIGVERTPEVIVLDENRRVRYHGRVDDQYGVGYSRDSAEREDLAIALEELLAGKVVSVSETESVGCFIGRVKETTPRGSITYAQHIAPLLNNRCVKCHRDGEIAPFSLTRYEDVIGWEDTILEVIDENRMPPWFANPAHGRFSNDARLSGAEKDLVRQWVENGMPEGDRADLPQPPQFAEGWQIPKPDQVIHMRDEPFSVPADGVVDYQYFSVDPGWDEDKYVYAAEARPDNHSVVHHIIVYVIPPGPKERSARDRSMLVGYAPGAQPHVLEHGIAMHVPANSRLLFELHYTPNGSRQSDRSYAGFAFLTKDQVRKHLRGGHASNHKFRIPPGADNEAVTANYRTKRDELLLSMTPHMHVRGKAFRYEAFYPDGNWEVLLDVPRYDFNWQLTYHLETPKLLPKGTRIRCTAWYDNSEANLVNPDPSKEVRWGDQSWEEMMIGFLNVVDPDSDDAVPPVSSGSSSVTRGR